MAEMLLFLQSYPFICPLDPCLAYPLKNFTPSLIFYWIIPRNILKNKIKHNKINPPILDFTFFSSY